MNSNSHIDAYQITLRVNGQAHSLEVDPEQTLLEVLNNHLGLGGVRGACGIGMCGACTVLIENRAISSCLMLAVQAEGKEITTIEGLAEGDQLHPVQQAYQP